MREIAHERKRAERGGGSVRVDVPYIMLPVMYGYISKMVTQIVYQAVK